MVIDGGAFVVVVAGGAFVVSAHQSWGRCLGSIAAYPIRGSTSAAISTNPVRVIRSERACIFARRPRQVVKATHNPPATITASTPT